LLTSHVKENKSEHEVKKENKSWTHSIITEKTWSETDSSLHGRNHEKCLGFREEEGEDEMRKRQKEMTGGSQQGLQTPSV